jgi:large subunit ribosomal protein L1
MPSSGKRLSAALEKVDRDKKHSLRDALKLVKSLASAKFNETVEIAIRLGVNPTKADQMVRGAVTMPKGTGKVRRIAVFAKGEKLKEAEAAGVEAAGADDLVAKVAGGWMDFDVAVSTPDMMGQVGKLGKVLGPRGLMPNPKSGTVTFDIEKTIKEIRAGKVEFRVDKGGVVHAPIGKAAFSAEDLYENAKALLDQIIKLKPSTAKGVYVKSMTVSSTMGPGVRVDSAEIGASVGHAA